MVLCVEAWERPRNLDDGLGARARRTPAEAMRDNAKWSAPKQHLARSPRQNWRDHFRWCLDVPPTKIRNSGTETETEPRHASGRDISHVKIGGWGRYVTCGLTSDPAPIHRTSRPPPRHHWTPGNNRTAAAARQSSASCDGPPSSSVLSSDPMGSVVPISLTNRDNAQGRAVKMHVASGRHGITEVDPAIGALCRGIRVSEWYDGVLPGCVLRSVSAAAERH
jgi:hypothetical protein